MSEKNLMWALEENEKARKALVQQCTIMEDVCNEARIYKAATMRALSLQYSDSEAFSEALSEANNARILLFEALSQLDGEHAEYRTQEAKKNRATLV